ncbi:MAG: hypothetical protein ABL958_14060 [Bdellovibrionia bacterium]
MPVQFFTAFLFVLLAQAAFAGEFIYECSSNKISFKVGKKLRLEKSANGWTNYWGMVDYAITDGATKANGQLPVYISWRGDGQGPQFRALVISVMDNDEAKMRQQGIEGGMLGFGAVDSREKPEGTFKATWKQHKQWPGLPRFLLFNEELNCRR